MVAKSEFKEVFSRIYDQREPLVGEDDRLHNIIELCPNHHRIQMDHLVSGSSDIQNRSIVYDFINEQFLIRDEIDGRIGDWTPFNGFVDVRKEYFAHSNSMAEHRLKRRAMRVDRRLVDPKAWVP